MRRIGLLLVLGATLALACAQSAVETGYEVAVVMLPEGQPEAGREAFKSLGCVACHAVAWEQGLPSPTSARPGPELGVDAVQSGPGSLATSIIAPSHRVSEKYQAGAQGGSPMLDYTNTMTIRQLADVVAYLQRQGLETQAKTQPGPG
jgi:mono/diheme cytochrome c family protein